ncbi:V-type ATP synthase subunit F [Patescibacteria group bacterium]|nr:V-type ATP synthase subunit F [Patescibacteria group bacterium]
MKVAVLGEKKLILAFKSLGIDILGIEKEGDFELAKEKIANDDYGVLFITESTAKKYNKEIEEFYLKTLPAVLIIPGTEDVLHVGKESLKKTIERALGSDLNL